MIYGFNSRNVYYLKFSKRLIYAFLAHLNARIFCIIWNQNFLMRLIEKFRVLTPGQSARSTHQLRRRKISTVCVRRESNQTKPAPEHYTKCSMAVSLTCMQYTGVSLGAVFSAHSCPRSLLPWETKYSVNFASAYEEHSRFSIGSAPLGAYTSVPTRLLYLYYTISYRTPPPPPSLFRRSVVLSAASLRSSSLIIPLGASRVVLCHPLADLSPCSSVSVLSSSFV